MVWYWIQGTITLGLAFCTVLQWLNYRNYREATRTLSAIKTQLYIRGVYEGYSLGTNHTPVVELDGFIAQRLEEQALPPYVWQEEC